MAEFAYNNSIHASTKVSPFFANYNFQSRFSISIPETSINPPAKRRAHTLQDVHRELSLELRAAGKKYKAHADRHRMVAPTFAVSDMVWLPCRHIATTRPCAKLDYKKLGPFYIVERIVVLFRLRRGNKGGAVGTLNQGITYQRREQRGNNGRHTHTHTVKCSRIIVCLLERQC